MEWPIRPTTRCSSVTLDIAYPDVRRAEPGPAAVQMAAIPVVLAVLSMVTLLVSILGWIAILVSGTHPRWIFP